jgi:hypothetical protein
VLDVIESLDAIIVLLKVPVSHISRATTDSKMLTEVYNMQWSTRQAEMDGGGMKNASVGYISSSDRAQGGGQAKALRMWRERRALGL